MLMASCRPTPIIGASTSRYVTVETPTESATPAPKIAENRSQAGAEPGERETRNEPAAQEREMPEIRAVADLSDISDRAD